jgi:glycosyltransferase involved in cell wall biosynthesis
MRPIRVLTWHVHGNYLYYLSQCRAEFYLPVRAGGGPQCSGRGRTFPFGANVHDVPAEDVKRLNLDCVLYQSPENYERDRYEILSPAQQRLPAIYLEHDPPRRHPTDTQHPLDDTNVLLIHVTPFNRLMWDSGRTPTRVIEHGVIVPDGVRYTGEFPRGIVVMNHLKRRGRRLGSDIFEQMRRCVPLDLVGMGAEEMGGLGEVPPMRLAAFQARYRFFFHPIRYTSLGLAVCEAMMLGMPIIGPAATELVTVVENGMSGYVDTDVERLVLRMLELLEDPAEARRLGEGARRRALERFSIDRFARDWEDAFAHITGLTNGYEQRNGSAAPISELPEQAGVTA